MKNLNWKVIGNSALIYTIGGIVYTVAAYATIQIIEKISMRKSTKTEARKNKEAKI